MPKFRIAAMVAAAAFEELLVALFPAAALPVPVGVELAVADEEEVVAPVKFVGSRWPQSAFSVASQAA